MRSWGGQEEPHRTLSPEDNVRAAGISLQENAIR